MSECSPFQGTCVGEWGSTSVHLSETRYDKNHRTAPHAHGGATVAFVLRGGFIERQGSRAVECGPGTVVLRPGGFEHDDTFVIDGCSCFNIEMPAELFAGRPVPLVHSRGGAPTWVAQRILVRARSSATDPLTLEAEIAELVDALCPPARPRPPARLHRVEQALRDGFAARWSLGALAREASVHPMHLARTFRQTYGESVGAYVCRLRVEFAARELARTTRPLTEIAHAAGFADQAHLTRMFRARTGVTPARFRAVFRNDASIVQDASEERDHARRS